MSFYTFGDSHGHFGWIFINGIKYNNIGSVLAYSLGRDKLGRLNIKNFNVKDGDNVCFCFGEIDCRGHVYRHVTPENNYEQVIETIIGPYFEAIEANSKQYTNLKVCVYNVVPPVIKELTPNIQGWPYLGTNEERLSYVKYFNKRLAEECAKREFIFIDIYDKYADKDGFLNKQYSDGITHIRYPGFLEEYLKEHGLI